MAEEGAVAVCVRVRPLNDREEALGGDTQIYWKTDNNAIYQVDGSKSFNFDRVFHSNETTKHVYEEIAVPIIDSAIQGYNGTIFAYGQTASGKTYTMMGSQDYLGVIPRAIHDIFQKIKKFPDREFLLRVSYMEIYNETITDLLCDTQKMKPLIIREDFNRNVYVADLTEEVVYTSDMALKWITKGEKNRHYGITKMNQRSSRSHTIFRMILESREKGEPSNCDGSVKVSHLNLVDLAGSERAAQTGAEGVRLKEGCNINRSLFILGQVIKKLSDGQVGGFINYRDSKLTRILQNSLGGNAKTRIICTVTPVSFDETLTTLQFASTAKYMKNTPYVNEVSSDEALLKRYRKEIMDLKKQLEEVSLETRAQAMEKDQLAQLLEEKDLLQKVQTEKIQNLTRMLVTSSSLTSHQELKAKRKRRVTWCLGKINKMKDSNYINEFNMSTNITTRKAALTVVGEIDESLCSESDVFSNTFDTLNETEWNPATKLLSQENLESELNSLRANYDNLVLDYEQLRQEHEEMELKLKEKNDLDEFEALERKAEKDQEMQLIHEISNLKNLVKHAEVYNQDLENELSSKVELLREKEDQIKKLQKYIDSQKSEDIKTDLSYSSESTEDLKQMKQTLLDAETVVLDAKRESAFLRSENLELKEKMKELRSRYKQMENDIQLYQRQLEAKKKMQVDLEKELQSSFNEITKLTSLIDGKVPKGLLCNLELERKITDFQRELNEKVEENEALHKEVKLLSALKSLPSEIEMLRKEIHDKSEELYIITSEREKLNSEVVQKESRIQDLLEEIGKTKNDLATIRLNYESTDQEFQDFKNHHIELEQKYKMVLEENARMNQELGNLSEQAQKLGLSLDALSNTELSPKSEELLQKTTESQKRLNEVEELKEQLESTGSRLQTIEKEKTLIAEQLQQTLVEVRTLTQEKDDLKQLQESLQIERDQLKSDIQDTVNMNIDTQEQLRNALEALKQHQEVINTLRLKIAEKTSRHLETEENLGEAKDEFQEEMVDTDKKQNLKAKNTQALVVNVEDNELTEQQRNIFSLIQEKNELQRMLESVTAEKEQLKTDLRENIEMTIENQEELRILGDELKKQQEILVQEKNHTIKKEEELSRTYKKLAEVEEKLKEKNQQLQEKQLQLLSVQEEMSEMQKKMNEMENVNNEFRNRELTLERIEMERLEVAQKLHENDEEMKSLTKERNDLKELQESFELEREQLEGFIREIEVTIPVLHEEQELLPNVKEVSATQGTMNEGEILKKQSKTKDSMTPARIEIERLGLTAKLPESHEEIKSLTEERDNLKTIKEAVQVGQEQLKEDSREMLAEDSLNISEPQNKQEQSFDMKEREDEAEEIVSELEQLQEQLKAKEAPQPRVGMERLEMSEKLQEVLQSETNQLKENMREIIAKHLETEEELKVARCHLKEQEETIDKLRVNLSERETELSSLQKELEITNNELQKKIQELHEKQQFMSTKEITETQEKMSELEQLKEQLRVKDSSLQNIESEKLKLTEKLQESQDKIKIVIKERDELKRVQELLQMERDQLKANIKEIVAEEYQQTISTRNISKKTDQEANIERVIESSDAESQEKIQELQEKEHQLLKMKTVSETQEKICEMEHLKNQFEAQKSTLENIEMENARLTQRLHENLEEMRSVTKERDDLRSIEETLKVERDQLKENLRETVIRDLEKQEELRIARMHVKEHQETIDKLRGLVSEKTDELSNMQIDLENTNDALKTQIQELQEKEHQLLKVKNDLRENMYQTEQLKEQLQAQHSTLESVETERLRLSQKLHENLEEIKCVTEERDTLKRAERTLRMEQCQLRESLREKEAQDLEKQEELRIVCMHVKEHQETIDKLRGLVSEKTDEIANMQMDLENSNAKLQEKIQQLKANEHQLFKLKEDVSETQKKTSEIERLKKQLKGQSLTLDKIEMENLNLAQKLHENLEEMKSVMQERDNLKLERDQLKTNLQETIARDLETQQELKIALLHLKEHQETIDKFRERVSEKTTQISNIQKDLNKSKDELQKKDQQNQKEIVKYEKRLQCNEKHHLTESLREKCSRIKELLKRYSEMYNHYECLTRLSLDLEKEIETQKELSVTIKANLSLPHSQIKQIEKLLAVNQRCSMEFHRIIKRFQYVLSQITKIKEEQHESINKLEVVFIDEVEKHNELVIKIQHLQQDFNVPSGELTDLKLSQKMDLRIEEILKDLSENDFHLLKTEFQQVLSNRREITQFLEEWLNTHFDIEKLKNGIQKENDNICQVNNFYNNKIIAIMNESTEFEERYAIIAKEWERDLNSVKEKNEQLFKNYQTLKLTRTSGIPVNSATEDNKNLHVTSGATQLTTEKIQELEASLHEAKESALHKENKIVKMQKELEMTNDIIAKLQSQVNESNKCLEKTKERIQLLQDKVALGAKPYKEEIEDLKMKLVKMDLEKKKNAKEFEKEITSTKATVEHQKEVIRVLRENLRRNQQAQDTSIVSEYTDSQPPNKPLTCGGGSGIVQSTKALILKSGYIRLEKEISKLKQQNEQLIKQKNELLSNNHHLSNEVKTWKERILKREAHREVTCENSPQSPKVTITAPKKRPHTPSQCKERNLQDPVPRESPKSWFFDSRSKSLPSPHPVRYFDNSGLGLCPEEQIAGAENVDPQPGLWHASSGKDVPECKTQ
ncbi:centromere-associated protein E isoform X3 [Canis lupus familiaris]|uniref:centromere-associated protein E isoform X3 n=1 Tax=Canis lupus familiaris TaxID=9615 RepID=UPI0002748ED8|nr:centromere-associated protein E isoform X3 [Canis lupus familiaris]XP_038300203.1 centromere-associated protein E isoform X3 [Canis lupus familiaris]XP_038437924.1 centromere-associated protein E isoform X3 [Canis lupus familiaris]|eukprot:XP_013965533.1 centromere-associated protein E isoform X3 [Canis lupus familiaris]